MCSAEVHGPSIIDFAHKQKRLSGSIESVHHKLQALVSGILPPATAVIDRTISVVKLSANKQVSLALRWHYVSNRQLTFCLMSVDVG